MKPTMNYVSRIVVLLMLLLFSEKCAANVGGVEAADDSKLKLCKDRSQTKRGLCFSNTNCTKNCVTEKYLRGECHGFLIPRCYCYRLCS
ncbi:hypothetical protein ABFS82_05G045900 [Erythranthe guttata]